MGTPPVGRPVRLGKSPTRPKTRILATGDDAVRLLDHLYRHGADRRHHRPAHRSLTATPATGPRYILTLPQPTIHR
jgi:hypothetical protein